MTKSGKALLRESAWTENYEICLKNLLCLCLIWKNVVFPELVNLPNWFLTALYLWHVPRRLKSMKIIKSRDNKVVSLSCSKFRLFLGFLIFNLYVLLLGTHGICDSEVCVHTAGLKFCSTPAQKWPLAHLWRSTTVSCTSRPCHWWDVVWTCQKGMLSYPFLVISSAGGHLKTFFLHWLKNALWACEEPLKCIMMRLKKDKMSLLLWWLLKIYETHFVPAKQTQLPPACLQEKSPL